MENNHLKILSKSEDELRVGNYAVLFGGHPALGGLDFHGQKFSENMSLDDFESAYTKSGTVMIDWDHGFDWGDGAPGRDDILGLADWKSARVDDRGLWLESVLNRRAEYMAELEQLIAAGLVGSSTEAVAREVHRTADGIIHRWPIKRNALTVTPAEPRMMTENQITTIKALSEKIPALKALISEDGATVGESANGGFVSVPAKNSNSNSEVKMTEQTIDRAEMERQIRDQIAAENAAKMAAQAELNETIKSVVDGALDEFSKKLPAVNAAGFPAIQMGKSDLGDTPEAAMARFIKTGDVGALRAFDSDGAMKASNATDMNITTDADGGYLVPTGHYQGIIAKRDESDLASMLGCRQIPGKGTTVNVPIDNEDDGEFIAANESGTFDQDSPAVDVKAFTLVKYTKQINLTYELLEDEDSKLMSFIEDFIGRGSAKTRNNLLLTEVATNGTALKTFASATAIAMGEPEDIVYNNALAPYLDMSGSVAWVMQPAVLGEIRQLKGDQRQYAYAMSDAGAFDLLGFPVKFSLKSGATAAATKSVYFGNWNLVGVRDGGGMQFLRDPYSNASKGWVNLFYYDRVVFGVLQAEAIGYGLHPTA